VDSILANSKPLTITIAHFGTSGGFSQKTIDFIGEYIALIKQHKIPKQHKVYLDISAVALDKDSEGVQKLTPEQFVQLKTYILNIGSKNIAFGTDYPLYTPSVYADILKHKVGLKNRFIKQILAIKK
jgi:predicted TIM-barrel fold metal-dependent hydrolase